MTYTRVSIWMHPGKFMVCGYYRGELSPIASYPDAAQAIETAIATPRRDPLIALCGPLVELDREGGAA